MPPKCIPGAPANVTVKISDLNLTGSFKVRDVWAKKDLGPATVSRNERDCPLLLLLARARKDCTWLTPLATSQGGSFDASVPHHGSVFLVLLPEADTEWPEPFKLAPWMQQKPPPV